MTKLILLALLLSCAPVAFAQQSQSGAATQTRNLMPVPASLAFRAGRLPISKTFAVAVSGHTDGRLEGAIDRAVRRLERQTGMELARGLATSAAGATLVVAGSNPFANTRSSRATSTV